MEQRNVESQLATTAHMKENSWKAMYLHSCVASAEELETEEAFMPIRGGVDACVQTSEADG